jgi:predicted membrane channel-forming protein YqfA (hemolysin III family)
MKYKKLVLALSVITALLCLGAVLISYDKTGQVKLELLGAGALFLSLGIGYYLRKPE